MLTSKDEDEPGLVGEGKMHKRKRRFKIFDTHGENLRQESANELDGMKGSGCERTGEKVESD